VNFSAHTASRPRSTPTPQSEDMNVLVSPAEIDVTLEGGEKPDPNFLSVGGASIEGLNDPQWRHYSGGVYRCKVAVCQEDKGFSVHAGSLPGVVSEGETIDEAIGAIVDALEVTLAEYLSEGSIPWQDYEAPEGDIVCERWIVVNV